MSFESVDALQKVLTDSVFHYAKDTKKAAGRALGTLIEIITFYLLKSWGFEKHMAIERRLPEYGNAEITHNVEFSLHPSFRRANLMLSSTDLPITAKKIARGLKEKQIISNLKPNQLLSSSMVLRNACTIYEDADKILIAYLSKGDEDRYTVAIHDLLPHPFAVLECKRVGVEEGVKKGPQTIEKAKQGAYVARTISSLQKIRKADGSVYGILHLENEKKFSCKPYDRFLQEIISSDDPNQLKDFILTVGVVSNHGNWFTSEDHNKELKVLAQSYDWLLFLTDDGLSGFVESLIFEPPEAFEAVKVAFGESYSSSKRSNTFTKVKIALDANSALQKYFSDNLSTIERWFNIISPEGRGISELKKELVLLGSKDWKDILK